MKILIILLIALIAVNSQILGQANDDLVPIQNQICINNYAGYFWDGQKCEICRADQCLCNSYRGCNSCINLFSLAQGGDGANTCWPCNPSIQGTGNIVTQCCFEYNQQWSVRASACRSPLQNDADQTKYMLVGSYCYFIRWCLQYTDFGLCTSCQKGYYLDKQAMCQPCVVGSSTGCAACNGPQTCTDCLPGFYFSAVLSESQQCKPCSSNCICLNSTSLCTGCQPSLLSTGFVYDSSANSCTRCPDVNCLVCNSQKACTQCNSFSILSVDKCISCPTNCNNCTLNGTTTSCSQCYNGFYKQADGTCSKCSLIGDNYKNVLRCTGNSAATTITQCQQTDRQPPFAASYYLWTDSKNVAQCILNTNLCKSMSVGNDGTSGQCSTCYEDFNFVKTSLSNKCKYCGAPDNQFCVTCKAISGTDNLACTQCITNINVGAYSISKTSNFYLQDGKCFECSQGCLNCAGSTNCTNCQDSYLQDSNGNCNQCTVTGCRFCSNGLNTCNQCFGGMRVFTSNTTVACERCPNNCLQCNNNRNVCEQCIGNYFLVNGICYQTRSQCSLSNNDGSCKSCYYGFRLVQGYCLSCASNGYITCNYGCTQNYYTRDGDKLTQSYETNPPKPPTSNNLIKLSLSILVLIGSLIILF